MCVARRTEAALKPLVEQITAQGGRAFAFGLDARREDEVVKFFQHIEADIGPINVLVFNVGGNKYRVIMAINYQRQLGFIRFVGTHAQYDQINAETV